MAEAKIKLKAHFYWYAKPVIFSMVLLGLHKWARPVFNFIMHRCYSVEVE